MGGPDLNKPESKVGLKKQITLLQGVSVIVGIIIGSGIFVSPIGILRNVQSVGLSLIMWVVCGVFNTLCALCYAELGTTFPASGGAYVYVLEAFGKYPAFVVLWINGVLLYPVSLAASSLVFGTYILQAVFPDCEIPGTAAQLLAALLLTLLVALNTLDVSLVARLQVVMAASKLCALALIVIVGFIWIGKGEVTNFYQSFSGSDVKAGQLVLAMYSGFWAFSGWDSLNFLTEELVQPHKNLPLAILISMGVVTLVYLVANVAYFAVLSPIDMLQSSAVAVTFLEKSVPAIAWLMPVLIAASVSGSINGMTLSASRLLWAGAMKGHFPSLLNMLHVRRNTPMPALILLLVISLILQLPGDIFLLIEMDGFCVMATMVGVFAGQVYLRLTKPRLQRPIKVPLALPIVLTLACLAICLLTVYQKPWESAAAVFIALASLPVYVVCVLWEDKPKSVRTKVASITGFVQKLLLVTSPEKHR